MLSEAKHLHDPHPALHAESGQRGASVAIAHIVPMSFGRAAICKVD